VKSGKEGIPEESPMVAKERSGQCEVADKGERM